jgi:hypothetical protein
MALTAGALSIELANIMLNCLCAAVQEAPNPPANCCFRIGQEAAGDADTFTDLCCEGLAYVMPGDSWPSDIFPNMDITRQANAPCGIVSWVQEYRLGIMRCAPTGTDTTMPTCSEWNAAAIQNLYDAESIRRAACCFKPTAWQLPEMDGFSIVVNRLQQGAVQGGCVERWTTIQVQLPGDCCSPLPTPVA